jgi:hypothetical protein
VSVGDRGTQVCAVEELNNENIDLFSIFDGNPPTPIWSDNSIFGTSTGYGCSSSSKGDYHVVMYHVDSPDIMNRIPHVNCYQSDSPTPIWTWNYGTTINYGTKVAIDRDATVVAVAIYNNNTAMLDLFFFDPPSGALLDSDSIALGGLRGFDLSADGSTLYYHDGGSTCYIYDIATKTVLFSADTGGSFDGHCISGDGTKFANGSFGKVKIWEFDGTNWLDYTYSLTPSSGRYADEMDFSDDGSTLGFGVTQYSPNYGKTEAHILDIATKTVTASVVNNSNGVYQDTCSAAAISHDGRYFALGRWGDQANANPEVQILENNVGVVGTIDTRGSVFGADISRDGQITVAGGKAIHANISGNGGDVYCYDLGNEDMELVGPPAIGQNVEVKVYTDPNWFFLFILGSVDAPDGFVSGGYGTLYLDITPPNFLALTPTFVADPSGVGSVPAVIPNDPALVGFTLFLQGVFSPGTGFELSDDYLTMTILP